MGESERELHKLKTVYKTMKIGSRESCAFPGETLSEADAYLPGYESFAEGESPWLNGGPEKATVSNPKQNKVKNTLRFGISPDGEVFRGIEMLFRGVKMAYLPPTWRRNSLYIAMGFLFFL